MSIVTVITPTVETRLATVAQFKTEMGISGSSEDAQIGTLLDQATAIIQAYVNRVLFEETVDEVFREDIPSSGALWLTRWPVGSVTSVTVDGVVIDSDLYELDAGKGALWALDGDGDRYSWQTGWVKKIVVRYEGGFSTVPVNLARACLDVTKNAYSALKRDPSLKRESIPGVIDQEFWVGATGSEVGGMPSTVASVLDPYRTLNV